MSDVWQKVRSGLGLADELVIDCHTHMGPWYNFHIPKDPGPVGMIAAMDRGGVDNVVCAPHVGIGPDPTLANKLVAEAHTRFAERFMCYITVSPRHLESEMLGELERWCGQPGFVGIKIHPGTHEYPADGPNYAPMWRFADENGLPVLIHTWESSRECGPLMSVALGKEFPGAKIILGHSGGTSNGMDQAMEAAREHENLFLDLTSSWLPYGKLEELCGIVGAERVLFGTDLPFVDCLAQIGRVAEARISDDDKRLVFGLNAKRVFGC